MSSLPRICGAMILWLVLTGLALFTCRPALAAAPVCARVKIEILQQLAFERLAFDARLVVTNSTADQNLEAVSVNIQVMDETGADAGQLFFVKVLTLDKISAVDGTGSIPPQVAAEVHWMLIPSAGAGGTSQLGKRYFVGGEVAFTVAGAPQKMTLLPAMITVKPQPELELDYFLPREVWADDPFTDQVEAPIPFYLGVRTNNTGYGPATNLTITSGQPKIVENKQGLLIDFRLLGSAVNDRSVTPTLNLLLGTIQPQSCATGRWEMVTTLSGKFIDFNASFTHASELGGTLTSLMKQVKAHFLTHEMLVDTPGSDLIHDFLAYDSPTGDRMPDTIYTSDCQKLPVNTMTGQTAGMPTPQDPTVTLTTTVITGWAYAKVLDPAEGKLRLKGVSRSDGKNINLLNAWITEEKPTGKQSDPSVFYLNIIDFDTTGSYLFTYETPPVDTTAPVTTIVVEEPKYGSDPVYVTGATKFLSTATDNLSRVSTKVYVDDSQTPVGYNPVNLGLYLSPTNLAGPHTIRYYSVDSAGNTENQKTMNVVVDDAAPVIEPLSAAPAAITPSAPVTSILPRQTVLTVRATDTISLIAARYDVATGNGQNDTDFAPLTVVRTITGTLTSGAAATVVWNGRNDAGNFVPAGVYTVRMTATDQLGHPATAYTTVTVNEFLTVQPLSATATDQINPVISGNRIAWQDFRNGKWDIFVRDLTGGPETNLTATKTLADQTNPTLDGSRLVWQDRSSGNWDIVLYDLDTQTETVIASTLADETHPVVRGNWLAWQAGPTGNRDIYLYNFSTKATERITTDLRDQIRPAISGNILVWEDYRNGLADIYAKDLISESVTQITDNNDNQTWPTIYGTALAWVDQRHGNRELYTGTVGSTVQARQTYSRSDEAQPYLDGNNIVYVDYAAGINDSNLSIINLVNRRSERILSEPHRQENPKLEGNRLVWQDDRSGVWQIYVSEIPLATASAVRPLAPGLNLAAVTDSMKNQYGTAFALLSAWRSSGYPVSAIETYHQSENKMIRAEFSPGNTPAGSDFPLVENSALYVHASGSAELNLGEIHACGPVSLKTGLNMVSYACLPDNFMASDLARSMGISAIQSIARFNHLTARWVTMAIKNGSIPEGEDFPIVPGEGYLVYSSADIAGWTP